MKLGPLSSAAALAGVACATTFVWALAERLDRYSAPTFVGLLLASAGLAVVSHVLSWLSRRRRQSPPPSVVRGVRVALSVFAVAALLWTALPSVSRPIAGWAARQIAAARYHE